MNHVKTSSRKTKLLKLSIIPFICLFQFGFVLVDGPSEAKLESTELAPEVTFYWDGSAPNFTNVERFLNGAWQGLPNDEIMQNLIIYAFAIWNDVPGAYVQLSLIGEDNTLSTNADDGVNLITVGSVDSATTSGFALPNIADGKIIDCDITLNKKSQNLTSVAFTLTHEIGHCLGLGHPHTSYKSIMSYSSSGNALELSADDKAGIIYLYPDSDFDANDVEHLACGNIGVGPKNWGVLSFLVFLMMPLLTLLLPLLPRRDSLGN